MERSRCRRLFAGVEVLESRIALSADPSFASQWSLSNTGQTGGVVGADINAIPAWGVTTGSRSVVVATIDSGIDFNHPDLAANIFTNPLEIPGNGVDDDHNGYVDDVHGWDFVSNDNLPQDGYGHGTHVAGIIGAVGNNGIGIAGVNWQVSILPLRFENDSGSGYTGAAISAMYYVNQLRREGIPIVAVNMSFGSGTTYSQTFQDAITVAGSLGITCVMAAGNSGANNDLAPQYPACYSGDNVITVAATDASDNLSPISNYGATSVDLAAPGINILSTLPGGGYGSMSGSSMAAPHVTGAMALLAAAKPTATGAQIRSAILGSVDPLPSLSGKVATGGRLDVFAALGRLGATSPAPTPTPTPAPTPTPTPTPAPTLLFRDDFSVADTTILPSPWKVTAGRFAVSNQQLVSKASGASIAIVGGLTAADVTVRSTIAYGSGGTAGLVLRSTEGAAGSCYLAALTSTKTGPVARIWKFQSGSWTQLAAKVAPASRGTLEFSAVGTHLSLSLDGKQLLSLDDSSIRNAGNFGYRFVKPGGIGDSFAAYAAR